MIERTLFTPDHEAFRDSFKRFLDKEVAPFHADWEEQGFVDRAVWNKAGENGFLCATMPEAYGGSQADKLYSVVQMEESGLKQHAVLIDLYAKVLADNLNALVCMGASENAELPTNNRHCNRAYAGACLQRLLPRLVMGLDCLAALLEKAYGLLGANSHKRRPGRTSARTNRHVKPQPSMAYKG